MRRRHFGLCINGRNMDGMVAERPCAGNIADMEYKELTVQQNSNTIYIQREAVNMPVIRPIRELQNTTEISHFAKTLNEPIFITKNGRNDLVLMNDAVYERIMAQNEMYRKLAAAEAEVADGAELLDGMEVLKELRGKYGK